MMSMHKLVTNAGTVYAIFRTMLFPSKTLNGSNVTRVGGLRI